MSLSTRPPVRPAPAGADDLLTRAARWGLVSGSSIDVAWFERHPGGRFCASGSLAELCGPEGEAAPENLPELLSRFAEPDRAALLATLTIPLEAGSSFRAPVMLVGSEGELVPVELLATWVASPEGPVLVGLVTRSRSAEEHRLADAATRYRSLTEVSPDIIVVHQRGIVVYANPATFEHMGFTEPAQLLGQPILNFFSPASKRRFLDRLATMASTGGKAEFTEEVLVTPDGREIDIEATSLATTWNGEPAYQAVARVITERKAAERRLREQADLMDLVSEAVIRCEGASPANLRITSWSKGAERCFGWSEEEVRDQPLHDVLGIDEADRGPAFAARVLHGGSGEFTITKRDGDLMLARVSSTVLADETGAPVGLAVVVWDITEQRAAEESRRQLEEQYQSVVEAMEEGVVVIDVGGRVQSANAAAERILGVPAKDLMGIDLADGPWKAVDEQGLPLPAGHWPSRRTLITGRPVTNVIVGLNGPGGPNWLSINCRRLHRSTDESPVVCTISDITESKAARERLEHAATHDNLTGLPNRAGVEAHLAGLPTAGVLTALFIDLDNFKAVNDSLGHVAGDQVLQAVSNRVTASVRADTDLVGRLAGDEFIVLCQRSRLAVDGEVVTRVLRSIEEPIPVRTQDGSTRQVRITASVGVAHLGPGQRPEQLLSDADVAMYSAKRSGGAQSVTFDDGLRELSRQRLIVRDELRETLETSGLSVAYQPIVDAAHQPVGFEALARWEHPARGVILPSEFIRVAEDAGMIAELDLWVLRQAAHTAASAHRAGRHIWASVNLSARTLLSPALAPAVTSVLTETGLAPDCLCLEVTEGSVITDVVRARRMLQELKALGVRVAIDDFGTGYSSLAYLDEFPFDVLKIDRSFVQDLGAAGRGRKIVAGIILLAHSLGLEVIAEGVETHSQVAVLGDLGVDAMQGYLFGRPAPTLPASGGCAGGRQGSGCP
jgi:diguanylate cyclase (GGDEF)-like protein/PAS domain S-box-containing protein